LTSAPAFRHDALVYESGDEYVERSVAFLKEGLDAGEGAIVAHSRTGLARMREALGPDAERVALLDVGSTYVRPAWTVATYYGAFVDRLRTAPTVRAVADVQFGSTFADEGEWARYEAITNVAYSHLPVWVVCTYDANELPDQVVDAAARTHSELLGDEWHESDHFEEPRELVRSLTPAPKPLPDLRSFAVGDDLERFRERLAREMVAERMPEAKILDVLVAASEVAANAIRHGGGIAEVRVGEAEGRFVCEVVDRGSGFDDPMAGYLAPRDGTGEGLWVARRLTWDLESFHSPRGFTVRIWI
jgi:anti-sigma regulatory factor (Ser/Thr protein kinase)